MMDTALFSPLLFPYCLSLVILMQCVMFAIASSRNWMSDTTRGAGITGCRIDAICPLMCYFVEVRQQTGERNCRSTVWFYSLSGERQIEYQWCASRGCKWLNNFPRFHHSFIFSTVFCRASHGSLNAIYPSSLLTIVALASSAPIFRSKTGCI